MKLRWGICGAGKISNDFCSALKTLPETEHEVNLSGGYVQCSRILFKNDLPTGKWPPKIHLTSLEIHLPEQTINIKGYFM